MLRDRGNNPGGGFFARCNRTRGVEDQQGIMIVAAEQNIQGGDIAIHRGVIAQIQRIIDHKIIRQYRRECGAALITETGNFPPAAEQFVQRHCCRCRAVAHNGETFTAQRLHKGQGFHGGKHLVGILHPQQTGALDCRIIGDIQARRFTDQ